MDSKESEKMRLELELFLNNCLEQKGGTWPLKRLNLQKQEVQTPKKTGVFAREQK